MKKFDVIIVGGGPAGAAAAKVLSKNGIDFCLIEKYKYPRKKLCAGGLTHKSIVELERLGLKLDNIKSRKCKDIGFVSKSVNTVVNLNNDIYMVDRTEFDRDIIMQSSPEERIFDGEKVEQIKKDDRILVTDKDEYSYRFIIFSDGVNGFSSRLIKDREYGFSVECESKKEAERTIFDFTAIKDGYGWVFPKEGHTTLGLGRINCKKDDYASLLKKFCKKYSFDIDLSGIKAYRLPIYSDRIYRSSVIDDNVILTGDAASLADGVSGEGIYYALASGRYAAESISEAMQKGADLKNTYFDKSEGIAQMLEKRMKLCKMLYSPLGNHFIKLGLGNDNYLNKIQALFG